MERMTVMLRWLKIAVAGVMLGSLTISCGVAMVRPVTVNTHKRPTFTMGKVNRLAVLEAGTQAKASAAADLMSLRLLDHGFNVIERARIKDILKEYDFKLAHDEDVEGAKKLGALLDADSILIVSVSDYTSGQQMIPKGCMAPARIETVVSMGITSRLVDINTSEVIWIGAASTQDKGFQICLTRMSDKLIETILEK